MVHVISLMHALPFAVTPVSALVLAHKMRRPGDESWRNDHFTWQIRTFRYLLPPALVGLLALLVGGASTSVFVVTRQAGYHAAAPDSLRGHRRCNSRTITVWKEPHDRGFVPVRSGALDAR